MKTKRKGTILDWLGLVSIVLFVTLLFVYKFQVDHIGGEVLAGDKIDLTKFQIYSSEGRYIPVSQIDWTINIVLNISVFALGILMSGSILFFGVKYVFKPYFSKSDKTL